MSRYDSRGFASWEHRTGVWLQRVKRGWSGCPFTGDPSALKRSPVVDKEVQFGSWAKPKVVKEQVSIQAVHSVQ